MNIEQLTQILQASIAPCVLISGIGLYLLTMTNRLSRPIDRIRMLTAELERNPGRDPAVLRRQMSIFYRRSRILRNAIGLATASIFFIAVIILFLFGSYVFSLPLHHTVEVLFTLSLVSLIASLLLFLLDIKLTLDCLDIEIKAHTE